MKVILRFAYLLSCNMDGAESPGNIHLYQVVNLTFSDECCGSKTMPIKQEFLHLQNVNHMVVIPVLLLWMVKVMCMFSDYKQ